MGLKTPNGPGSVRVVIQYRGLEFREISGPKSKLLCLSGLCTGMSWLGHFWGWGWAWEIHNWESTHPKAPKFIMFLLGYTLRCGRNFIQFQNYFSSFLNFISRASEQSGASDEYGGVGKRTRYIFCNLSHVIINLLRWYRGRFNKCKWVHVYGRVLICKGDIST